MLILRTASSSGREDATQNAQPGLLQTSLLSNALLVPRTVSNVAPQKEQIASYVPRATCSRTVLALLNVQSQVSSLIEQVQDALTKLSSLN